ncbi:MAG TPA: hypothetical protein VHF45_04455, partial [Thermoleophilaceae bacterium]|nr:hypothetical protein [Thermoleophilaceae bacterium]
MEERGAFLPPEPPGPEPQLGDGRTRRDRPAPAGPPPAPPPAAPGSEEPGPHYGAPSRYGWQQSPPRVGRCEALWCQMDSNSKYYTRCTYQGVTYRPLTTRIRS